MYYYVKKGIIQSGYTGFFKSTTTGAKCYIYKGVFQSGKTGIVKSPKNHKNYYVKKGKIATEVTGIVKISGSRYKVVRGLVVKKVK